MLLDIACKNQLVDALNGQAYSVNGREYTTLSMRAMEDKNRDENSCFISVEFTTETVSRQTLSTIVKEVRSEELGTYHVFGQSVTAEVIIKVGAKEQNREGVIINPRYFTEAIMNIVKFRVRKYWLQILATFDASFDVRRVPVEIDLTPYVQAEMRSERIYRIYIKYQDNWTFIEEGDDPANLPSDGFSMDAASEYYTGSFNYVLRQVGVDQP